MISLHADRKPARRRVAPRTDGRGRRRAANPRRSGADATARQASPAHPPHQNVGRRRGGVRRGGRCGELLARLVDERKQPCLLRRRNACGRLRRLPHVCQLLQKRCGFRISGGGGGSGVWRHQGKLHLQLACLKEQPSVHALNRLIPVSQDGGDLLVRDLDGDLRQPRLVQPLLGGAFEAPLQNSRHLLELACARGERRVVAPEPSLPLGGRRNPFGRGGAPCPHRRGGAAAAAVGEREHLAVGEEGVRKGGRRVEAARWVVAKELLRQVDCQGLGRGWKDAVPGEGLELWQLVGGEARVHGAELGLRGRAEQLEDLDEVLLRRVLTLEGEVAEEQLGEDGADGPHVDGARVLCRAEEQLGCAVVARANVRDVWLSAHEHLCAPKVNQLEPPPRRVDQEVVGLEVAVTDPQAMDVL
mmetsp:Transcript_37869/g.122812  ORF Transcript_37869/g.122812 Transcript_37869/m.122812 type:complete len:416 (-) Transcript_37869:463-1710(-)